MPYSMINAGAVLVSGLFASLGLSAWLILAFVLFRPHLVFRRYAPYSVGDGLTEVRIIMQNQLDMTILGPIELSIGLPAAAATATNAKEIPTVAFVHGTILTGTTPIAGKWMIDQNQLRLKLTVPDGMRPLATWMFRVKLPSGPLTDNLTFDCELQHSFYLRPLGIHRRWPAGAPFHEWGVRRAKLIRTCVWPVLSVLLVFISVHYLSGSQWVRAFLGFDEDVGNMVMAVGCGAGAAITWLVGTINKPTEPFIIQGYRGSKSGGSETVFAYEEQRNTPSRTGTAFSIQRAWCRQCCVYFVRKRGREPRRRPKVDA